MAYLICMGSGTAFELEGTPGAAGMLAGSLIDGRSSIIKDFLALLRSRSAPFLSASIFRRWRFSVELTALVAGGTAGCVVVGGFSASVAGAAGLDPQLDSPNGMTSATSIITAKRPSTAMGCDALRAWGEKAYFISVV
jgi:hypothetical protein